MKSMKQSRLFCVAIFCFLAISCSRQLKQPVDYVDPFICTEGDHGQWDPSATVPFGLVKLGPDSYPSSLTGDGDFAHSGYNYSDTIVRGFSHFHKGSSGGTRIGNRAGKLSVMPFIHEPLDTFLLNPLAKMDKNSEKAQAGYYAVKLKDGNILAELTATPHAGIHRYTFPEGETALLYLNEGNTGSSSSIFFRQTDEYTFEGLMKIWAGIHFVIKFDQPVLAVQTWTGSELKEGLLTEAFADGGLVCSFGDLKGKPLTVKTGVSLSSLDAAKNNFETECAGLDFDQIRQKASELWNDKLAAVQVKGNEEYKTIFYTALYHSCFLPVVLSDVDGTYPGLDQQVHKAEGYRHYFDYAFWDSFRTKYPLYSLYLPGAYREIVQSLRDIYEQADNSAPFPESDHTPHGSGFGYYGKDRYMPFGNCRNEHMLMVMVDAWTKGLFVPDMKDVYPYLKKEALVQMPEKYDSIGYIPARPDQTGEYAWDNWCVAQVAKSLGNEADYEYFIKRSEYWRNTWDLSLKFFRARAADGTWLDFPEDPTVNREKYTYEGTKWQYRWNVLHDVPALMELFEGKENFVQELEYFFENDLYTAGNQIDLHAPFLFNMAGAPWLSQKWVNKILTQPMTQLYGTHDFFPEPIFDRIYKATPDGYLEEMDCDYGCMASWYAMSAMGLFQVCPGNPVYQITSPIFEEITIHLDQECYPGKSFTIRAKNLSPENYYIQSAIFNGKPFTRSWLTHEELVKGGELVFEMGNKPNKDWGIN
jgi:predicted alpha-1,2-mannosidase